jgi:hypothetical protein
MTNVQRSDGKVVGHVVDGVFTKKLAERTHLLHQPPGWAFDISSLHNARRKGAEDVVIEAIDTGRVYSSTITAILRYGVPFNRGHGDQVVLALSRWTTLDPNQPMLFPPIVPGRASVKAPSGFNTCLCRHPSERHREGGACLELACTCQQFEPWETP